MTDRIPVPSKQLIYDRVYIKYIHTDPEPAVIISFLFLIRFLHVTHIFHEQILTGRTAEVISLKLSGKLRAERYREFSDLFDRNRRPFFRDRTDIQRTAYAVFYHEPLCLSVQLRDDPFHDVPQQFCIMFWDPFDRTGFLRDIFDIFVKVIAGSLPFSFFRFSVLFLKTVA